MHFQDNQETAMTPPGGQCQEHTLLNGRKFAPESHCSVPVVRIHVKGEVDLHFQKIKLGISLAVQLLKLCLPMQGVWV